MTKEEAGEIILAGEKYEVCTECSGRGRISSFRPELGLQRCTTCSGKTILPIKEYREACDVLNLPYPKGLKPFTSPTRNPMRLKFRE